MAGFAFKIQAKERTSGAKMEVPVESDQPKIENNALNLQAKVNRKYNLSP